MLPLPRLLRRWGVQACAGREVLQPPLLLVVLVVVPTQRPLAQRQGPS